MASVGKQFTSSSGKSYGSSWAEAAPLGAGQLALYLFLATVTMLFAGFTSAILVRRTALDWQPLPVPGLLWVNTAVLFASSLTMERVRALARRERWKAVRGWLSGTTLLGVLFLIGQVGAWRQLAIRGVYLSSNPHSSFFYILTGAHGVHLLGGLLGLSYLLVRSWPGPRIAVRKTTLNLWATYWHFLDALWIYLFAVLFVL